MATTKKRKKASKNAVKSDVPSPGKITLPAFGLAEEIPGDGSSVSGDRSSESEKRISESAAPKRVEKMHDILSGLRTQNSEPASDGKLHLVTFHLDAEEFGVDIGRVQEIIRVGQITDVPNAPEFIRGVINLRGKIIPVLDLRRETAGPSGNPAHQEFPHHGGGDRSEGAGPPGGPSLAGDPGAACGGRCDAR